MRGLGLQDCEGGPTETGGLMSQSILEQLLEAIDTETGKNLLRDLKNPELRTPQLYNAVGKYLDRHL